MSNGQTKRVNLTLHLNPGESQADLRTVAKLTQWHNSLKQDAGERDEAAMQMRAFHRNVYLAGLQLQLLSPQLCHHVAESISREHLTLPELVAELARCELLPEGTPVNAPATEDFSKQQLKQLELLLKKALPDPVSAAPALPQSVSQEMSEGMQAEFVHLRNELESVRALLEKQNLQLAQLRRSEKAAAQEPSRNGNAEEIALAEITTSTEKMKKIRQKGIF
ncbi:hypothetical protein MUA01_14850 [Enterobacteriaceae bacterium H18W14]|uniref:hypothetical protein n=1 Tax=Dryocola boscaweniae TaxID=2925397 RepID=UPI0022F0BCEE|nr:hypothetical protein [Dryocola boscaweniae]MCT4716240.1 hypothetical protein [Dryocola boscaweniae]